MMNDDAASKLPLPTLRVDALEREANEFRETKQVSLAAFIGVFTVELDRVVLVELGDYARGSLGGNPWTLPGGAVEPDEAPSLGILREFCEETGYQLQPHQLVPVAWIERPYRATESHPGGELILLFAAKTQNSPHRLAPTPEILAVKTAEFDLEQWLQVPAIGTGDHPLQPLRRHWIHWAHACREQLSNPSNLLKHCVYRAADDMQAAPCWT